MCCIYNKNVNCDYDYINDCYEMSISLYFLFLRIFKNNKIHNIISNKWTPPRICDKEIERENDDDTVDYCIWIYELEYCILFHRITIIITIIVIIVSASPMDSDERIVRIQRNHREHCWHSHAQYIDKKCIIDEFI